MQCRWPIVPAASWSANWVPLLSVGTSLPFQKEWLSLSCCSAVGSALQFRAQPAMLSQFCRLSPVNAVAVPSFNPAPHIKRKDLPMFKQLLVALITVIAGIGFAFAQIDVNKADQSALDGIKGIGPAMSKHIL